MTNGASCHDATSYKKQVLYMIISFASARGACVAAPCISGTRSDGEGSTRQSQHVYVPAPDQATQPLPLPCYCRVRSRYGFGVTHDISRRSALLTYSVVGRRYMTLLASKLCCAAYQDAHPIGVSLHMLPHPRAVMHPLHCHLHTRGARPHGRPRATRDSGFSYGGPSVLLRRRRAAVARRTQVHGGSCDTRPARTSLPPRAIPLLVYLSGVLMCVQPCTAI